MTDTREFVLAYRLNFAEGEPEFGVLHRGDRKSCEDVANIVPAISYSGDRDVRDFEMAIIPASELLP